MSWVGYTDGGVRVSNPGLGACAFALYEDGEPHRFAGEFLGTAVTNNHAEYRGLLNLLRYLNASGITGCHINCDSELMVKQVKGTYQNVSSQLQALRDEARLLVAKTTAHIFWVPREQNQVADRLVNDVLDEIQDKQKQTKEKDQQ